ncbi:hypothetical protein [Burkholderia oklahomensis]|uniref:hypothetical protein n=1 Tax=Burkholderia oklahomensis TaxID=342113 RepID=UPI00016A9164|nr:hypothetical protein [Burkholderia oklahomensis]AJX36005.1 hypothetical protein BG90_4186 [Burkholderia oklahomensis C6786]AOI47981.1 hypothetical protein WI23_18885 [Burkholderia oklahomensis C6786]KUY50148.1 hypothetical protein WI23_03085 [Burkholderia oklahomensis C6786]MBI0363914.1 hypothetical protein [Burkholderia oklahomensis]SUY28060.1 Uncharacterised protein [Burkholderia oklahomensis]
MIAAPAGQRLGGGANQRTETAPADARITRMRPIARTERDASRSGHADAAVGASKARRDAFAVRQRLNAEASGSQQVLDYLGRFAAHLKDLKGALGTRLAGGGDHDVRAKLDAVSAEWARRHQATGGRLNNLLEAGDAGAAQRSFVVRGLNGRDGRRAEGEMLTFYLSPAGARSATVYVEANLSARDLAARLKQGLAALGVDVRLDAHERIRFSVSESKWSSLEEGLRIRGGGVRFPAGQPQRPALGALPGVIEPSQWSVDDRDALHASLRRAVHAIRHVESVCETVQRTLRDARRAASAAPAGHDAEWARATSAGVAESLASGRHFCDVAALNVAASGVRAARVRELLALR